MTFCLYGVLVHPYGVTIAVLRRTRKCLLLPTRYGSYLYLIGLDT